MKHKIELIVEDTNINSIIGFGERIKLCLELSGYEVEIVGETKI